MHTARLLARLSVILGGSIPLAVMACGGSLQSEPTGSGGAAGATVCQRALPVPTAQFSTPYCHTKADCPTGTDLCTAVEAQPSCGPGPSPPPCTSDAQCSQYNVPSVCESGKCRLLCQSDESCGPAYRCDQATGSCEARACDVAKPCPEGAFCTADKTCRDKNCDPAEADACGVARVCDPATFDCVPQPCSVDLDCPNLFACEDGKCTTKTCSCDSQCGASGYCIRGYCSDTAGQCAQNYVCGRPLVIAGALQIATLARSDAWG